LPHAGLLLSPASHLQINPTSDSRRKTVISERGSANLIGLDPAHLSEESFRLKRTVAKGLDAPNGSGSCSMTTMRLKASNETSRIEYTPERLLQDLRRVKHVYDNLPRGRLAIYDYWTAAYKLRWKWRRLRRNQGLKIRKIAKKAVSGGMPASSGDDLLRLIIDNTVVANSQSAALRKNLSKMKSKYFSLLNFVYYKKVPPSDLIKFIEDHGGLNFRP
jgi:hypothetical protein